MSELPPLSEIPALARRQLLAALRGVPARGVSEEELEARQEKRDYENQMLARIRARCPEPREYRREVRAWRENHQRLRFIRKIAELIEEQKREAELATFFRLAVLCDTPPRKIVDALGMLLPAAMHRLKRAREDLDRKRRGLPTRVELAARVRAKYWGDLRASIEASRDPETGKRRERGQHKKKEANHEQPA
jgi:hypothetical protein